MDWRLFGLAIAAVVIGGCAKDNPLFGGSSGADSTTSTSGGTGLSETTSASAATTAGSMSASGTTTGVTSDATTTEPATTIEPTTTEPTTGDTVGTSTSTGGSSTTGEPPVCGVGSYGEAEVYGRYFVNGVAEGCEEISGRHFKIVGIDGSTIISKACATAPAAGCSNCEAGVEFRFSLSTPEPPGTLNITPCVYAGLQDVLAADGDALCRYRRAAFWRTGTAFPTEQPALTVLGHGTVAPPEALLEVDGVNLVVTTKQTDGSCSCVDAQDCCDEKTADYRLSFSEEGEVVVDNGMSAPMTLGAQGYTVYNGGAYEDGSCEDPSQHVDWWFLREG